MTTAGRKVFAPSLASIALMCASPDVLAGQAPIARPASVALMVVVPPHAPPVGATTDGSATVIGRTSTAVDVQTMVGLGDRPASRIEVRLDPAWDAESARVWVRNRNGTFEQLMSNATVVALDAPLARSSLAPSPLHFRVESGRRAAPSSLAIPVEYRLTVGAGDKIAVWTFPTLIRFDDAR
jgi:hypothetical protein